METIFHNEPRIEEWVHQITEKIFTVCLLTGVDSDAEFQKGCLIVSKIASLLLGFSTFPSQYLEEGLRQLLEQQFPDKRVINNFPTFYDTMNKMLVEGISMVIELEKIEVKETRDEVKDKVKDKVKDEVKEEIKEEANEEVKEEVRISDERAVEEIEHSLNQAVIEDMGVLNTETNLINNDFLNNLDQAREANIEKLRNINELRKDSIKDEFKSLEESKSMDNFMNKKEIKTVVQFESNDLMDTPQFDFKDDRIKHILSFIFPNTNVTWNFNLMGQTFLAQVEDILLYLQDQYNPLNLQVYSKEGWKVIICNTEDLKFPRRLERKIRQFLRLGKKS